MGRDDLFKKRRESRTIRKSGFKNPKVNSYLIVTEGTRTEPYYFRGLQKLIEEKIGGSVDIVEVPEIIVKGQGCSTCKLIEKTDEIVNRSNILYQNIWVLFDKDASMTLIKQ